MGKVARLLSKIVNNNEKMARFLSKIVNSNGKSGYIAK
jgi:hypothetical protein